MNAMSKRKISPRIFKRKNVSDVVDRCCVCFGEENLHNINAQLEDYDTSLLGALIFCLPDEIFSEKWTPSNLCSNCVNLLCYTYTFLNQVIMAQSILRKKAQKTKEKHSDLIDRIEIQRKIIKYHRVFLRETLLENTKLDATAVFNTDHDYQKTHDVKDYERVVSKREKLDKDVRRLGRKRRRKQDFAGEGKIVNENVLIEVCEDDGYDDNATGAENIHIFTENDHDEEITMDLDEKHDTKPDGIISNDVLNSDEGNDWIDNLNELETVEKNVKEEGNEEEALINMCNDMNKDDASETLLIVYNDDNPALHLDEHVKEEITLGTNEIVSTAEVDIGALVEVHIEGNNETSDEKKPANSEANDKKKPANYVRRSRVKVIKCNVCGLEFNQSRIYFKHMKTEHLPDTNVLCDICGKLCVGKAVLLKHKLSHTDERPFKCEICLRNFKTLRQLKIHSKQKHTVEENDNVFVCTVCSMKFMKVYELRFHLYTHTNQIPYACKICDKMFDLKDNLRNYKLEEDRNKPFTCDLCEQNDLVPNYADEVYIKHFNVPRNIVENLSDKFKNSQYFNSHYGQHGGIPAINQVLIFLWYLGNKTQNYRLVAEKFNITKSSLNRVIQRITTFLSGLSSEVIRWPTDEEKIEIESNFRQVSFPNVIGAIEAFCIKIEKPRNDAARYLNDNREHSIKIQIVSDHRAKILDVFIGCPGSVPVSEIFKISSIGRGLRKMCGTYFLLADGDYPLKRNLITPYDDPQLNDTQINFNQKLCASQNAVKLCFELLTNKFPQVSHVKLKDIELIVHFVRAVCVLHNITLDGENYCFEESLNIVKSEESAIPHYNVEDEDESEHLIRDTVAELLEG